MAKPAVIVVGADKGGVGKTTVSRTLLDYFSANNVATRAFDTESPRGTLKRFHPDVTEIVDMTTTTDQMKIFDTLNSASPSVTVIDVRAGLVPFRPEIAAAARPSPDQGRRASLRGRKIQLCRAHACARGPAVFPRAGAASRRQDRGIGQAMHHRWRQIREGAAPRQGCLCRSAALALGRCRDGLEETRLALRPR